MQIVLQLYPVAISGYPTDPSRSKEEDKRNKAPKRCVTGIIPDSGETVNGLYTSNSVMPAQSVEFWCSDFLAQDFRAGQPLTISGEVSARNERLQIQIKKIQVDGKWFAVDVNPNELKAEDLF